MAQVYQLVSGEISSQKSATTITTDIKDYEVYLQSAEQSDVTVDDIKNLHLPIRIMMAVKRRFRSVISALFRRNRH